MCRACTRVPVFRETHIICGVEHPSPAGYVVYRATHDGPLEQDRAFTGWEEAVVPPVPARRTVRTVAQEAFYQGAQELARLGKARKAARGNCG